MRTWMIISYLTMFGFVTGCYNSSHTVTPGGETKSKSFFGGFVSTSETDTRTAFNECRGLLKPGRTVAEGMIDREVYNKCFRDAMGGIAPAGQHGAPQPYDTDGDGRPDVVRYDSGLEVPYGLYVSYPGTYWPSVYNYYGYGGMSSGYGAGYGPMMGPVAAPLGASEYQGSIADPLVAGYLVANARAAATYPEAAKNPQEFVRRRDVRGLYKQTKKNADDISDVDAELQDHKKGDSK